MNKKRKNSQGLVFVTGGTGFIGSRLCLELLRGGRSLAIMCRSRSINRLKRWIELLPSSFEKPKIIKGDLQEKGLGIGQDDLNFMAQEVTDVFHVAAKYHLSMSEEDARHMNVEGTERILDLASGLKYLQCFNHVSSIAVSGDFQGVFLESDLDKGQDFPHPYSRSKFLSEQLVRDSSLPYSIYRPGAVVGDSSSGEINKVDGPYYVFKILHLLSKIPGIQKMPMLVPRSNDEAFHLVPVDFIVKAMAFLSGLGKSVGKTYHLVDPSPMSFREFYLATLDEMGFTGPRVPRPVKRLLRLLTKPKVWPLSKRVGDAIGIPAELMPHVLYSVTYNAANMLQDLSESGISCPPLKDYLPTLIEYYRATLA